MVDQKKGCKMPCEGCEFNDACDLKSKNLCSEYKAWVKQVIKGKQILDACCGSRMFWFDTNNPATVFVDIRELQNEAIWKSGNGKSVRYCTVKPDILADFTALPFEDDTFYHVIFDPPHLRKIGDSSWMVKKYGKLPEDWKQLLHDGFYECLRVLKPNGTLIFKWNEFDFPVKEIIKAIGVNPLYGHKSGKQSKTHWLAFMKDVCYGRSKERI